MNETMSTFEKVLSKIANYDQVTPTHKNFSNIVDFFKKIAETKGQILRGSAEDFAFEEEYNKKLPGLNELDFYMQNIHRNDTDRDDLMFSRNHLVNGSNLLNKTLALGIDINNLKEVLGTVKQVLDEGAKLTDSIVYSLIAIYSLVIVVGILGNILILWAVLGRDAMRTGRNVFIGTLAASDLFLCIFTMPSTLWEVLYRRWPFGPGTELLCRFANACRATPVFMSSFAIGAIAVDRYRCIMQPDKPELSLRASIIISIFLGFISIIMSIPLFVGTQLIAFVQFRGNSNRDIQICNDIRSGAYRWGYNITACSVQFVLPLLIVFTVYMSIYFRLKVRPQSQHVANNRRRRRTNILIIVVTLIFFLSWLPRNTLNMLLDFSPRFVDSVMGNGGNIHALVYGICHIMGLGNACINPVLYGYLNENFRKEYQHIFQMFPWNWRSASSRCRSGLQQNRYTTSNLDLDPRERIPLAPRQPCLEPCLSVMHPVVVVELPTSTDARANGTEVEYIDGSLGHDRLCSTSSKRSCSSRGSCPCEGCSCNSLCSSLDSPRSSISSDIFEEKKLVDATVQCESDSFDQRMVKINRWSQTTASLLNTDPIQEVSKATQSSNMPLRSMSINSSKIEIIEDRIRPSKSYPPNLSELSSGFDLNSSSASLDKGNIFLKASKLKVTPV